MVDLSDLGKVIAAGEHSHQPTDLRKIVVPGCPQESLFLSVMRENIMPPPPREQVSPTELTIVEQWIKALDPQAKCGQDEPNDGTSSTDEP